MSLKQAKTLMTQDEFWDIIANSNKGENLHKVLSALSDDKIFGFKYWWNYYHAISYKQDLWAVAYVVMSGCSDDCFMDFRAWLIAQGQEVFENALKNADSLCDVFDEIKKGDMPLREDWATVREVIDERHGDDAFDEMRALYSDLDFEYSELNPKKWRGDDENSIRQICPKTFDKWWDNDKF